MTENNINKEVLAGVWFVMALCKESRKIEQNLAASNVHRILRSALSDDRMNWPRPNTISELTRV